MRWSWIRAAVLGVVLGPTPVAAEPVDAVELPEGEHVSGAGTAGHAVRGPNFYVWDEDPREAAEWAGELLESGGRTIDPARWRAIAARSAALPAVLTNDQEAELTAWLETSAADPRLSSLGLLLCLLPSLDRTCLISSWATSPNERTRRALANALAAPFEAVGVPDVLQHLQEDASPEVRRIARSAAASRRAPSG